MSREVIRLLAAITGVGCMLAGLHFHAPIVFGLGVGLAVIAALAP